MAWAAAIPAVLQAGASILGQRAQARQQRRNVRDQQAHNIELAQFSHDRNVELWKKQTAYNTPEQQMQRFREAGLNPHLMYSQGQPGLAGEAPQMSTPKSTDFSQREPMLNPMQTLSEHLDIVGKKQQLQLTERQIKTEEYRSTLTKAGAMNMFNQADINALEATISSYLVTNHDADLREIARERIGGMKADQWLKKAVAGLKQWENRFAQEYNMHPRDSIYWRMMMDLLEGIGFTPKQLQEALK
jgi:hypothetical protein